MSDRASINFDRLAAIYDETRGGLVRGRSFGGTISTHLLPGTVVEIGVGTGSIALPMTDSGHPVVGVDLSPNMLELAHQRLGARVAVGDAMMLPIRSGSVPNVVAVWVFQLVGSVDATLDDARRVLSLGGRLVVIPSRGHFAPDDIDAASVDLQVEIRGGRQDEPEVLIPAAEASGLRLLERLQTDAQEFDESPAEIIRRIETRGYGILLDLGDDDWQRVVVPALDALRSLPDQDRQRRRSTRNDVLVFEAV